MGEHELHRPVANLPAEFLQDQSLEIGLIVDKGSTAPRSIALRRVSTSP